MSSRIPPPNDQDAFFIQPAVCRTLNILEAVKKSRFIRRVVVTSSIIALIPFSELNRSQRWISPIGIEFANNREENTGPSFRQDT
jgi:hypothetical protein